LLDINPKVAPSKLVNNLKTVSSRLIRKEFGDYLARFYRKPLFWSIGYAIPWRNNLNWLVMGFPVKPRKSCLSSNIEKRIIKKLPLANPLGTPAGNNY
jgi:hypothetical protein